MKRSFSVILASLLVVVIVSFLLMGCDDDEPAGTGQIQGNVESFENVAVVARLMAVIEGVTVYLDGPVSRSTTTDASGSFVFTDLPPGEYSLSFEYNGEEVTYRGNSGQEATITVEDDQRVVITEVTVAGGSANIGRMKIVFLDEDGNPIEPAADDDTGGNTGGDTGGDTGGGTGGGTSAPPASPDITSGLVAHYKMDGNVQDSSPFANHGTKYGAVSYVSGAIGQAALFDDFSNEWVEVSHEGQYVFTDGFTVHFWFYRDDFIFPRGWWVERLIQKCHPGIQTEGNNWEIYSCNDKMMRFNHSWNGAFGSNWEDFAMPFLAGEWHTITFTYTTSDNTLRGYLNGSLKLERVSSHVMTPMDTTLSILFMRDRHEPTMYSGTGRLDDVRIYNRALTAEQIAYLYTKP